MLFFFTLSPLFAEELRALTSNALAESFRDIIPEFERTTRMKVVGSLEAMTFRIGSQMVRQQMR